MMFATLALAAANRVLANAAEAMPAVAEIKQLLAESAARAAAQAEALQAALPHDVDWDIVAAGVRATYGEARRASRAARSAALSGPPPAITRRTVPTGSSARAIRKASRILCTPFSAASRPTWRNTNL